MSSNSTSSYPDTSENESEGGRRRRFAAKRKMLIAYHQWISSYGKPTRNRQNRKLNHVCSSGRSLNSTGVRPPSQEKSQKILKRIQTRRYKRRLYVKPLSPSFWEKVVENAGNYAISLRSISDMTFSTEVLNNLNFNECIGTSLKNFDWGNYLLYLMNLIWSLETIKKILKCGKLIKHCKGKVTGIIGLKNSDWIKFFKEVNSALEEAESLKNLIVCAHGIPLESIIASHSLPENFNWEAFFRQSNVLNSRAKNVLDYLLTIFFINDHYITPDSDLTKICHGIYEDPPETKTSENLKFKQCNCKKKKRKSGVLPIFLNKIKQNRSQARVNWIRSKYNIINKNKIENKSDVKNSIEYLTKQKLLSDDKTKTTEIVPSEKAIKENLFRRQTAHLNLPHSKNMLLENGMITKIPIHRYVSYLILNLESNENIPQLSNGSKMANPIKRLSKKINLKSSFKIDKNSNPCIDNKSKIFENPVPARPSVVPRIIQHEAALTQTSDEKVKTVRSSDFLKSSKSAIIFTNQSNERPSIPFSSLPRDHPLVPKAESLKMQLDIPVKKTEHNTDLGKENNEKEFQEKENQDKEKEDKQNDQKPDSIVNYCVYSYGGKKNLAPTPTVEKNVITKLEYFLINFRFQDAHQNAQNEESQ